MYPKNSASPPVLFALVVNKTTGDPITSGVTIKYSSGSSQVDGSGSAPTHTGNGVWAYTPTQAETNVSGFSVQYYHVSAVGNGPMVGVVTTADVVQTGDAYAVVTNGTYGLSQIKTETAAILSDTGTDGVLLATNAVSATTVADNALTSTKFATSLLNAIADAILKRDFAAVTGEAARSMLNALRYVRNKWSLSGSTLTVTKEDDSTTAWTASLTSTTSGNVVIGVDPA